MSRLDPEDFFWGISEKDNVQLCILIVSVVHVFICAISYGQKLLLIYSCMVLNNLHSTIAPCKLICNFIVDYFLAHNFLVNLLPMHICDFYLMFFFLKKLVI